MTADTRPFGLLINTAPDEFLCIGSGLSLTFAADSPGPGRVAVGTIDEGRYLEGSWVPGRRLNGDEGYPVLGSGAMGLLKIRLYRYE
jgi:hypothetical protein